VDDEGLSVTSILEDRSIKILRLPPSEHLLLAVKEIATHGKRRDRHVHRAPIVGHRHTPSFGNSGPYVIGVTQTRISLPTHMESRCFVCPRSTLGFFGIRLCDVLVFVRIAIA
jgi:hypothetical protein